jgi:hypothetical protein
VGPDLIVIVGIGLRHIPEMPFANYRPIGESDSICGRHTPLPTLLQPSFSFLLQRIPEGSTLRFEPQLRCFEYAFCEPPMLSLKPMSTGDVQRRLCR